MDNVSPEFINAVANLIQVMSTVPWLFKGLLWIAGFVFLYLITALFFAHRKDMKEESAVTECKNALIHFTKVLGNLEGAIRIISKTRGDK